MRMCQVALVVAVSASRATPASAPAAPTDPVVQALEQAIASPPVDTHANLMDAGNTRSLAVQQLAALHESRGEWQQALKRWLEWEPESWCGNAVQQMEEERIRGIARCQFHLGHADAAIRAVPERAMAAPVLNGRLAESVALYIELCARTGRLEETRWTVSELPYYGERKRFAVSVAVGEAFASHSAPRVLDAVRPLDPEDTKIYEDGSGDVDPEWRLAARLLVDMGDEAMTTLTTAVARGDLHAIVLAGLTGDARFIAPLEQRLKSSNGAESRTSEALARLRKPRQDGP